MQLFLRDKMDNHEVISCHSHQPTVIKSNRNQEVYVAYRDGLIKTLAGHTLKESFLCDGQGLLGLEFNVNFEDNGLFYINYVVKSSSATPSAMAVDPSVVESLCQTWINECAYSSLNITEEWMYDSRSSTKQRTLLIIKNPFIGHEGTNTLDWSTELDSLILATGDGGSNFDPFRLSQDEDRPHGKILSIDVESEVVWGEVKPIASLSQLNDSQSSVIKVVARGLMSPGSVCSEQDGVTLVADRGISFGKVYDMVDGSNYGWRAWDGRFITAGRLSTKNDLKVTLHHTVEKHDYIDWSSKSFSGVKKVSVAPRDKVKIVSTSNERTDIVQTDNQWKPLLNQNYSACPSNGIDTELVFKREGTYYLKSNYYPDKVMLEVTVTDDVERLRKKHIDMHELRNKRLQGPHSIYRYLVLFRQEALQYTPNVSVIAVTTSDGVHEQGKGSAGSIITGAQYFDGGLYISTLSKENSLGDLSGSGYLECDGQEVHIDVKGHFTALGCTRDNLYLGTFDGECGKVIKVSTSNEH